MKIAVVCTWKSGGGAGKAAYRLHEAFLNGGIESHYVYLHGGSSDSDRNCHKLISDTEAREVGLFQKAIDRRRRAHSTTFFSGDLGVGNWLETIFELKPDVVNIHWISGFVEIEDIVELAKHVPRIVITLHDQWFFTGGCHYSFECSGYKDGCRACPQVDSYMHELVTNYWQLKSSLSEISNLSFVAPSFWMLNLLKKNPSFIESKKQRVFNPLDTSIYSPLKGRRQLHSKLGLPEDSFLVLLGAMNSKEKRKGFDYFSKVLSLCREAPDFNDAFVSGKMKLVFFGYDDGDLGKSFYAENAIFLGHIECEEELADIYSSCDIFLMLSVMDNMPNMLCECLACETPFIAFNSGGVEELVRESGAGCIVPVGDIEQFSACLLEFYRGELNLNSSLGRRFIEDVMSDKAVVESFLKAVPAAGEAVGARKIVRKRLEISLLIEELTSDFSMKIEEVQKKNDQLMGEISILKYESRQYIWAKAVWSVARSAKHFILRVIKGTN